MSILTRVASVGAGASADCRFLLALFAHLEQDQYSKDVIGLYVCHSVTNHTRWKYHRVRMDVSSNVSISDVFPSPRKAMRIAQHQTFLCCFVLLVHLRPCVCEPRLQEQQRNNHDKDDCVSTVPSGRQQHCATTTTAAATATIANLQITRLVQER